jgi:glycogen phosphorylase
MHGVPYDTPILGYRTNTVNTMRLWAAQAVESFDFETFNHGDYLGAVADKVSSENISKILYPNPIRTLAWLLEARKSGPACRS